jgi:hypothetical protein
MMQAETPISLDHLRRLTDCFGVVQHANHALPDYRSGYTADDNARALAVAVKHQQLHGGALSRELATRYLAFLLFAQREDGRFHNSVGYDRRFLDEVGSEDCFGRSLWALAYMLCAPVQRGLAEPAERMLHLALPWTERLEHPRGKAFCLTALHWWSQARPEEAERARGLGLPLAQYLVTRYQEHSRPGWDWLLPELTYANAKLPEALFRAYQLTGDEEYLAIARRTMGFLYEKTFENGVLKLVGNRGWYESRQEGPPPYDQQPIDAAGMVEASLAGFDATGDADYLRQAGLSLEWFFGRNVQGRSLYDPETGGCFDGLTESGVNRNRGAESTISLLLAQLSVLQARQRLSRDLLSGNSSPWVAGSEATKET